MSLSNRQLAVLLVSLLVTNCAENPPESEPLVARFQGGEVTLSEWNLLHPEPRQDGPSIQQIVVARLMAAAARDRSVHLEAGPAAVLAELHSRPRIEALRASVREQHQPLEGDVEAYLDEHRDLLEKPEKVRLWCIVKQVRPGASVAERQRVEAATEAARQRVVAGEDFQAVARQESEVANRFQGGKMGPVAPGQLWHGIEETAWALEDGELSDVLEIPVGYVVFRGAGRVEARTMPEDEARQRIRHWMTRSNFESAWENLQGKLLATVEIEMDRFPDLAPDDVVARSGDVLLTWGEATTLHGQQRLQRPLAEVRASVARQVVEAQMLGRLSARRADELALEPAPQQVVRSRWAQERYLARLELEERAGPLCCEISEEEIVESYQRWRGRLRHRPRFELDLIRFRLNGEQEQLIRASLRAESILEALHTGRITFEDAAREYSDDPSAGAGGYVGWWERNRLAGLGPNVLQTIDAMEPGSLSDVVRQDDLWILRLRGKEPGRLIALEEARPIIIDKLTAKKKMQVIGAIERRVLEAASIEILDEAVLAAPTDDQVPESLLETQRSEESPYAARQEDRR